MFNNVKLAPPDPILGVKLRYNADKSNDKVDLGIGAYRDSKGLPYVLNVVKEAEQLVVNDPKGTKEYLTQQGDPKFIACTQKLLFGDKSIGLSKGRVATVQAMSGTGALRLGAEFIAHECPCTVYVPNPTWGNHNSIFGIGAKLPVKSYRYLDKKTLGLDLKGMLEDLENAPNGSCIILHVCAHNPTGIDPTVEQWEKILQVMLKKKHLPFFDSAYQGFASGDLDVDAYAVRLFDKAGVEMLIAQSYSKNLGLYGERIGALSVVCQNKEVTINVDSQLGMIVRRMYSNPPRHGAAIVATILSSPQLMAKWKKELKDMVDRIHSMRVELRRELERIKAPGNWEFITSQFGMFAMTALSPEQCERLAVEHHIFMTNNGRISVAGLTTPKIKYVANAIAAVLKPIKSKL